MMITTDQLQQAFPQRADIPAAFRSPEIHQREYLINGEIRQWEGPQQEVLSPVYERGEENLRPVCLGSYPLLTTREAMEALEAACNAYRHGAGEWPTMSVEQRIACVLAFAAEMKVQRDLMVTMLMWEIGKTYGDACKEFDRTVDYITDTVNALKDLDRVSSRFVTEQGIMGQIRRAPLGVVLCMGPFNYPLNETFTTLIPALIMGNTAIFKPAKHGALFFQPLLKAFQHCFPAGVVNTIYGEGQVVIGPLMESGRIDVLAFIGSARVANLLNKQHPRPNRLRSVLGLGAKNPGIILNDADLELTVRECLLGTLSYNGQRCTALKILFVQEGIAPAFLEKFTTAVRNLKVGMPWEEGVQITPLPEQNKTTIMKDYIQDAVSLGARVLNEGGGVSRESLMVPAVLYPVPETAGLFTQEQFGPLIPIVPFRDIEEPIDYIVRSDYGQQASIFGNDPEMIGRLIDPLTNQVCRLNINCQCQRGPDSFPFTGKKDSAEGTLSISDALRCFSIRTLVAAKGEAINKELLTRIIRERHSNFLNTDYIF